MTETRVVSGALLGAVLLAGIVGHWAGPETVFGGTPLGVGIYLAVGIGAPQLLLGGRRDEPMRLGLGALAIAGAGAAVIGGHLTGGVTDPGPTGVSTILAVVIVGVLAGAVVREFRAGYRASRREGRS